MRHELRTEITIDAPPEGVWRAITELAAYREWNPFIVEGAGAAVVGERLRLRMEPPGGKGMTFRPRVTAAVPGRAFEWLGKVGVPGLFDGRHRFDLVRTPRGTRLIHSEQFRGLLVRLMRRSLDGPTRAGFEAMNAALARRVAGDRAST